MRRTASYRVVGGPGGGFGLSGSGAPPPPDLVGLIVVLFVTYALQFVGGARIVELLRLTPRVYGGWVWQLATYPFVGFGGGGLLGGVVFLIVLLMIYLFGRDVFWRLGRRRFWKQIAMAAIGASVVAVITELVVAAAGLRGVTSVPMFSMIQGQHTVFVILIAIFATLNADAVIMLFLVVPMKARWFLWLEVLLAFFWFTSSRDLAGLFGIWAAVFISYATLSPGGPRRLLWRWRKELERVVLERRLRKLRRNRDFDLIGGKDDWVH